MKTKFFILISILISNLSLFAQSDDDCDCNALFPTSRVGIYIGGGVGIGTLNLKAKSNNLLPNDYLISPSIPNAKIGYFINDNILIAGLLPGAVYRLNDKDRVAESIQIIAQFWVSKRIWILGGIGVALDIPAFYTVDVSKDDAFKTFYAGFPSLSLGIGYEFYKLKNFKFDAQYRLYYGNASIEGNSREAISNMFILGANWYFSKAKN